MPLKSRADALAESPFSLSLSSGFFGYFAHLGFAEALEEKGLKPNALSGSSAGALVAAGLASGRSTAELKEIFLKIQKADFWDPSWGFGYLKGQKIEDLMGKYCVPSFEQTQVPLHISVFNIKHRRTDVVTAGSVAKACRASAAVPLMFHPVKVTENYCWDGGIGDRPGTRGVEGKDNLQVVHYLQAGGFLSLIEDSILYRDLQKNPYLFKETSPYKMGPLALDKGAEVIAHFHKAAKAWLEQSI